MEIPAKKLYEIERLFCQEELARELLHQINNSLAGILGYIQLLIGGSRQGEEERQDLKAVEVEVLRSRKMIQSFMDLFQQYHEVEGPLEMNSLLDSLLSTLQDQEYFVEIEVKKEFSSDDLYFQGNLPQWRIALMGLMLKAAHEMGKKGILQVITLRKRRERNFELVIRNSCMKMSKEPIPQPFIPFSTSPKRVIDLGIYLAQLSARQSGGSSKFKNFPQGGSTVSISLPLCSIS